MRRYTAVVISLAIVFSAAGGSTSAKDPNHAVIVVTGQDAKCVAFDEDEITGTELLDRSGIDYVAESSSIGTAMCAIDGRGCDKGDCFCEYPSFWGYWVREPGAKRWRFSDTGSAERTVRDGSLDGWSYGKDGKPAPADVDFGDVCGAGAETVSATSSGDATPLRSPGTSYITFAAFVALLAVSAAAAYVLRRRRS